VEASTRMRGHRRARIGMIGRISHRLWGNNCRSFGLQAISGQKVQLVAESGTRVDEWSVCWD